MSAFHEGYLPLSLSRDTSGGPERRTEVVTLGSGREARNAVWAHGRRRYEIGGAVTTLDMLHAVIAFFEARRGRLQGFRFHDVLDGRSCLPTQSPTPLDQQIGVGDGTRTAFQLLRAYGCGADRYIREIRKPVAASVRVAVDGVALPDTAFGVDATTGIVTLATPPAVGLEVSAGFTFDTPVRIDGPGSGRIVSVPLLELVL